jgi:hypothetical protein
LVLFFRFTSSSGTTGLVPVQYRFNTVGVFFERNLARFLDRYIDLKRYYRWGQRYYRPV